MGLIELRDIVDTPHVKALPKDISNFSSEKNDQKL